MSARIPVSEAHRQQKKRKPQTTSWSPLCVAEKQSCSWKEEEELQSVVYVANIGILFHTRKNMREIYLYLTFLQSIKLLYNNVKKHPCFVKIVLKKNGNFVLALRKRLFCSAKPTLLPCKRATFGMRNNRFCKALINRRLCDIYICEKYLQLLCDLLGMNWWFVKSRFIYIYCCPVKTDWKFYKPLFIGITSTYSQ